ncbi:hypothetical protein B0T20DRAFT_479633 [Sordaria brevicollis]|uniref:Uncharacterized protein n=1 Tax=Sordaria brevicollis TaxID=83679 RepID=A0AAE0PFL5_SORBR|nr:hypothetical protein B0T20DRAFT_479633 [Sordaria brevicollis]
MDPTQLEPRSPSSSPFPSTPQVPPPPDYNLYHPDSQNPDHNSSTDEYDPTQPHLLGDTPLDDAAVSNPPQAGIDGDIPGGKNNDVEVPTASPSDDNTHCKIDLSNVEGIVAWRNDTDPKEQHTSDLRIDLHVDTKKRLAMFRLHCALFMRPLGKFLSFFLLLHPEWIQSIEFNPLGDDVLSLQFTMTKPPRLVAPKEYQESHKPKPRYQGVFDSMKSLATMRQLTVRIHRVDLTSEDMEQLALLPWVFSSSHSFGRFRTDEELASFDVLFRGAPGQIIDLGTTDRPGTNHNQTLAEIVDETTAEPTDVISVPPPYPNGGSSPNAPGYSTPNDRKRRRSASLSLSTADRCHGAAEPGPSLIRTIENERSGERVQSPSASGARLQSPNQSSTPTDRKRRRTSELLSRSPSDKDILIALGRVLERTANLDARVKELEKLVTEYLDAEDNRTTHSEQEGRIHGQILATVDERIDDHMWEVQRELEDALLCQTQEWVTEAVELAQDELQEDMDDWVNDITERMEKTVKKEVKREVKMEDMGKRKVLKDMVQAVAHAVKMIKRARAYKEDVKSTTRRMSPSTASTQSTAASTKPILIRSSPSLPRAFHSAIRDIQKRFSGKFSAEELMRVLDHLEANQAGAVKYNGCGAELKWLYVQRWAAKPE